MYNNLIAEAARKGLSYATMAEKLKMHRNTFENKINGKSKIFLEEAENLHREFFPEFAFEYLFAKSDKTG